MEKRMSLNLQNLLLENLNLDLFYSISIGYNGTRLLAEYSKVLEEYLLQKSFHKKNYMYEDDLETIELENVDGSVRIVLMN